MRKFIAPAIVVLIFALVLLWSGCDREPPTASEPSLQQSSAQKVPQLLGKHDPRVDAVIKVQDRHTARLMAIEGVVGTATGLDEAEEDVVVKIYVEREGVGGLPAELEGVKVDVEVTGKFVAFGKPGGVGKVDHKAKQTPPIQLGTSGGWGYDLANGYCCGGTLGSLIAKGGKQYILSNYHVLEADIVAGGNNQVAQAGDPVIQPGLIDVGCNAANGQDVATLSGIKSLPASNVDAAIAEVLPGQVRTDGAILEIGTISSETVAASLNQAVKKSGRTTGLTRSKVSGLNATVSVAYDNECAGGAAFTKTFTGQIIIANRASKFLAGGDSGSLMVQDVSTNPKAVGLLYAGSSSLAVANPIGQVLSFFGATMVGQ